MWKLRPRTSRRPGPKRHGSRIEFRLGDFLTLAPELAAADLVTLDRVVCCYTDFEPLLRVSASKARRWYALSVDG